MAREIEKTEVFVFMKFSDDHLRLFYPEHSETLDSFLEWKLDENGDPYTTNELLDSSGFGILGEFERDGGTFLVVVFAYRVMQAYI